MKRIMLTMLCVTSLINAASNEKMPLCNSTLPVVVNYKSTQEVLDNIMEIRSIITTSDNIFLCRNLISQLRDLGSRVNTYIMKKQGIIAGKASKGNLVEKNNVFDIWSKELYKRFIDFLEKFEQMRVRKINITQVQTWKDKQTFIHEGVEKAKKAFENAILDQKKKVANITIFFAEAIQEINDKAVDDYQKFTANK